MRGTSDCVREFVGLVWFVLMGVEVVVEAEVEESGSDIRITCLLVYLSGFHTRWYERSRQLVVLC